MGHVQWELPALVGIREIDQQHREWHGLLLKLFGTLATDANGALSEFRFIRLVELTVEQFKAEEECLQSLGYPDLANHHLEHEAVLRDTRESLVRWDAPDAPPLIDLVEDFAESNQHHMDTSDQAFAHWLEQKEARSAVPATPRLRPSARP